MFKGIIAAFAILAVTTVAAFSSSDEFGTREEAIAMVARVQEVYKTDGLQALIEQVNDIENASFHDRDLYVFIFDMNGVTAAHGVNPKLVGKSLIGIKDQNGVEFVREMVEIAQANGEGWVDYHWPNPATKKLAQKSSLTVRLDDTYFVGVGIYVE